MQTFGVWTPPPFSLPVHSGHRLSTPNQCGMVGPAVGQLKSERPLVPFPARTKPRGSESWHGQPPCAGICQGREVAPGVELLCIPNALGLQTPGEGGAAGRVPTKPNQTRPPPPPGPGEHTAAGVGGTPRGRSSTCERRDRRPSPSASPFSRWLGALRPAYRPPGRGYPPPPGPTRSPPAIPASRKMATVVLARLSSPKRSGLCIGSGTPLRVHSALDRHHVCRGCPRSPPGPTTLGSLCGRQPPPPPAGNGTGNSPSPGQPTPGVVKQDKSSGGSVDTTKTRSGPQRVRMSSGERPIGAAKGKQSDTEALCQPPPPPPAVQPSWHTHSHPPAPKTRPCVSTTPLAPRHCS